MCEAVVVTLQFLVSEKPKYVVGCVVILSVDPGVASAGRCCWCDGRLGDDDDTGFSQKPWTPSMSGAPPTRKVVVITATTRTTTTIVVKQENEVPIFIIYIIPALFLKTQINPLIIGTCTG